MSTSLEQLPESVQESSPDTEGTPTEATEPT